MLAETQFPVQEANGIINKYAAEGRRNVIRIRVTETAPIDYGKTMKLSVTPATLGHALIMIDQFASTLMQPRVDTVIYWCDFSLLFRGMEVCLWLYCIYFICVSYAFGRWKCTTWSSFVSS